MREEYINGIAALLEKLSLNSLDLILQIANKLVEQQESEGHA